MAINTKKISAFQGGNKGGIHIILSLASLMLLFTGLLCVGSTADAQEFTAYSGQQYKLESNPNLAGYEYAWSLGHNDGSDGSFKDGISSTNPVIWTAPVEISSKQVVITITVSNSQEPSCKTTSTITANVQPLASLGDLVWNDLNANGIRDTGEIGVDNVEVNLLDSLGNFITSTTTDGSGIYSFTNLVPGTYQVEFVLPSGFAFSPMLQGSDSAVDSDADTGTGKTAQITLVSGQNDVTRDAGMYSTTSLGDFVWDDLNANGIQDSGEPGIANVQVELLKSDGTTTAFTTSTDVNGLYSFTGLMPGTYLVKFILPSGYSFSPTDQGSDNALDSDADTSAGTTSPITLTSGQSDNTRDAGMYSTTSLGDLVWNDRNANGIQDSGEMGMSGVQVELLNFDGTSTGLTTTTDSDGKYSFPGLVPGAYQVKFILPYGYKFGPQDQGSDNAIDSDADASTGITAPVTLISGQTYNDLDAGITGVAKITLIESPIGGDGTFGFTGTGFPDGSIFNSPTLGPVTYNTETIELQEGQDYIICQTSMPSYWSLVNIVVEGASNVQYGSDGNWHETFNDIAGDKCVKFQVDPGANVKVTFINQKSSGPQPTIPELSLTKTALNTSVHRGEDIYYEIKVCNDGFADLTNVKIWDVLPKGVELIATYPETGSGLAWDVGTLSPGQCSLVRVVVRVPITDMNYDMTQGVQGTGFVNVHNDYDTHQGPESITNCAYAKADLVETVSSCASTSIVDPGTELKRREFGSGTYESEELTRIRTENKSIKTVTSLSAVHQPTTFALPQGRSMNYGTKWTEKSKAINTITGATMNEEYTHANNIDKDRSVEIDKNGTTMKTEVSFEGAGHIGVLKKESADAHPEIAPTYEAREDYVGKFNVYEMVDEYGSSVQSNKSVTGYGYVNVDKRVKDSQRTYESGTGSYESEELIDTPSNYIAKSINLVYAPASYSYSPSFQTDQDMKWSEGMWSKSGTLRGGDIFGGNNSCGVAVKTTGCSANATPPATYISERYSSLDYLKKETIAAGLNEMNTNVSFSGQADYRVKAVEANHTGRIDNEERYVGQYDITRKVLLTGVSRYDRPHLTVIKEGRMTTKWFNKTNAQVAEYVITITNDGNRALAPIYVRDLMPSGTEYISSSIRPSSLSKTEVDWTLLHLGIGNTIEIELELNVTEYAPGNVVNRVMVCGMNGDVCVSAGNYSALESGWLTCCPPELFVDKTAELDALDPTLVHYTIVVKNNAKDTLAATLTDKLPGGMSLLQASVEPNVYADQSMQWVIPDLTSGEVETIDYDVRATMDGSYVNLVHVDATAVDGTGYATMDAAAYIDVRSTGVAPKTTRYGGWQPPDWNMTSPDQGITIDLSPDEDLVE
jgi:uncharacterized repeat protein (TIGR01451 family)